MFTGIITAIGTIDSVERQGDLRVRIAGPFDPDSMAIGASIACSGVCLTVVERGGTAATAGSRSMCRTKPSRAPCPARGRRSAASIWSLR